ncbi:STAS domain-containing protein [Streptomyces sp. NPDC052682]|uniref:STAS domain-containing protein n=1 Tax=Streptomyces sp. NPDC052682 TaxID=3154954 RepID=UPI003424EB5D
MTQAEGPAVPEPLLITQAATADGVTVVTLRGEVDYTSGARLTDTVVACMEAGRNTVVDMSAVTFIDSTGINTLVAARQAARNNWLRLVVPPGPVLRVVRLVGLDTVMGCHATLEEALNA